MSIHGYRIHPQPAFNFSGLVIDNFAGGGGASTGIEMALGRPVDIAVNHDPEALAMHDVNHPHTRHYCESVWDIDPRVITQGQPVDLCWFSPDCKHFSKAKGGTPVSKKIRGLAWVALRYAATVRPRVIMLENVEEFVTWGPITSNGRPCPDNKGRTFAAFVNALRRQGYAVEWRELRACDYGAPTIRKRLFLIARCDAQSIIWPEPTHADPASDAVKSKQLKPWSAAADIIDWTLPCPSIFLNKQDGRAAGVNRPLVDKTMQRIARGIERFLINSPNPFVVPSCVIQHATNSSSQRSLTATFIAKHYGGGYTGPGANISDPLHTVTTTDHNALITAELQPAPNAGGAHAGQVRAFLLKYYGTGDGQQLTGPLHTVTTKDRYGLVTVKGQPYQIVDIGMRMLAPHELYAAQGFPADYIHNRTAAGKPITKTAQVRMCGNSVCPPVAAALVKANLVDQQIPAGKEAA